MPEVADDLVELLLPHLAVGDADARLRHQRVNLVSNGRDVLHAVVHIEHLAAAQQFSAHGRGDLRVLVGTHIGKHRQTVFWRCGERGHLTNAGHGHFQRTRNRRGGQGQHVHVGAQGFQRFLVFHTETLLLVDDDESQILELDFRVQQLVCADDHVHRAGFQSFDGFVGLLGGLEAAHGGHIHRESFKAVGEGFLMLLNEQSGGHEHRHLLAVLYGFECGTYGDFGFAEAHITADKTVHGHGLFHVGLDLVDGGELVCGLLIGEGVLHLLLPWSVRTERKTFGTLTGGVELNQVFGNLVDVLAGFGLGGRPVGAAEFVELGDFGTDVFADLIKLIGGDEQLVRRCTALGRRVFDDQVFTGGLVGAGANGALAHFHEPADAVLLMHHIIALFEFHQIDGLAPAFRRFGHSNRRASTGQVAFGEQGDFGGLAHESIDSLRPDGIERGDAGGVERTLQTSQGTGGSSGNGDVEASIQQAVDALRSFSLVSSEFRWILRVELHMAGQCGVYTETGETNYRML